MNPDKSHKFMASMMSAAASMEIQMFGNVSLNCSTSYLWLQLCKISFSAYTEGCHQVLRLWITFELWKDSSKYHMKDLCAISYGQILMIEQDGAWIQEELATPLAKISQNSTIILTT